MYLLVTRESKTVGLIFLDSGSQFDTKTYSGSTKLRNARIALEFKIPNLILQMITFASLIEKLDLKC